MMEIDFNDLGMPVFTGRARGEDARRKLKLDDVDRSNEPINVVIPSGTYALTSSYFLGMFGPSVKRLGTKEAFKERYTFNAPEGILSRLDDWIDRALREQGGIL